jgi:hypothetical protein
MVDVDRRLERNIENTQVLFLGTDREKHEADSVSFNW